MRQFWFETATHRARIGTLSGGEQRRLQLLAVLAQEPNVLLLDEPTNDLDMDTLRALENWLDDFQGALVVVSHDRVFLERVAEHVAAVGKQGLIPLGLGGGMGELEDRSAEPKADRAVRPTLRREDLCQRCNTFSVVSNWNSNNTSYNVTNMHRCLMTKSCLRISSRNL